MEGQKMEQFNRFLVQFISKDFDGIESVEVEDFEVEHPMAGEEAARWTGNMVSTCCNHAYKYARTFINSVLNIGYIASTVFVSVFLRDK